MVCLLIFVLEICLPWILTVLRDQAIRNFFEWIRIQLVVVKEGSKFNVQTLLSPAAFKGEFKQRLKAGQSPAAFRGEFINV